MKRNKKTPCILQGVNCYLEAAPGFEPGMMDLQSTALPLGYAATKESITFILKRVKKCQPGDYMIFLIFCCFFAIIVVPVEGLVLILLLIP